MMCFMGNNVFSWVMYFMHDNVSISWVITNEPMPMSLIIQITRRRRRRMKEFTGYRERDGGVHFT